MPLTTYRIDREGADRLLFLLHGWSAEQHHLAAYVPLVDPDERFTAVCPRARHDLPEGDGASWYERTESGPDPEGFHEAVETVASLMRAEATAAGIPLERCVLGGFSQGGFLTLALAGRVGAPRLAGAWAMCSGMPDVEGLELDLAAGSGTPALIQVGELDTIIPPERGRESAAALRDAGWVVTEASYDMGHSQRLEMFADAKDWLGTLA